MARLVLHIGQTKTASTSIQYFCHHNRDWLMDHRVHYFPCPPNNISHRFIIHALELEIYSATNADVTGPRSQLVEMGMGQPGGKPRDTYENVWNTLASFTSRLSGDSHALLSEELLWHLGGFNRDVRILILRKLRARLASFVDIGEITIVACLRNQIEWAESWHNQLVKDAGNQSSVSRFIQRLAVKGAFAYNNVISDWQSIFPEAKILLIDFQGQLLNKKDTPGVSLLKACGLLEKEEDQELILLEQTPRLQESIHPFVHHWITRVRPPKQEIESYREAIARASQEVALLSKEEFGNTLFTVLSELDIEFLNGWSTLGIPQEKWICQHGLQRSPIERLPLPRPLPMNIRSACKKAFGLLA